MPIVKSISSIRNRKLPSLILRDDLEYEIKFPHYVIIPKCYLQKISTKITSLIYDSDSYSF